MGRGRQKAKHTKVARELKYFSPNTDYNALERELTGSPHDDYSDEASKSAEYAAEDDDTYVTGEEQREDAPDPRRSSSTFPASVRRTHLIVPSQLTTVRVDASHLHPRVRRTSGVRSGDPPGGGRLDERLEFGERARRRHRAQHDLVEVGIDVIRESRRIGDRRLAGAEAEPYEVRGVGGHDSYRALSRSRPARAASSTIVRTYSVARTRRSPRRVAVLRR